ncbi:hypothetical protein [Rhizobium rosettiformans]|jgi:Arc/MetJ-type ribon-helix-helix transcriptional regulator|uniref:hypothetical protein n=1 Tax=Rhizobium rosettiformans TaxID=1368430 RepID=UPI0017D8BB56|nr:hypothetical protein [Rhizobium rosettiformans]MBA4799027.1 hypothetical protein [Hyphomicrobiales bacterium]MDR7028914.1 Arc/MetJ-type ribon-helix-helix transcriptional regulator [Rhizobium rosettiformans]MDR7063804.1 Arc/MetJ-type ribon-helix-helix transcriptional regulator [Rhizobium rosettiformans]
MERRRLNIVLDDDLAKHLDRRVRSDEAFGSADEYVGALIRRDMEDDADAARYIDDLLSDTLVDGEQAFRSVTAVEVLRRNSKS